MLAECSRFDRLELYRWAVQDPETHAAVLRIMYERVRPGRTAMVLREDFAGTSAESVAWVALKRGRRAVAVDLDAETLRWAEQRARRLLAERAEAVRFVRADVRSVGPPEVTESDIISTLNFSIMYWRDRANLLAYLRQAARGLRADGILVCNLFGGVEAIRPHTDWHLVRPTPRLAGESAPAPFKYGWEVRGVDASSRVADCRMHFETLREDGVPEQMENAFQYDFRLWSPEELVEVCLEAGFSGAQVWRHTFDPSRGREGVFLGRVEIGSLRGVAAWTAYVVAIR